MILKRSEKVCLRHMMSFFGCIKELFSETDILLLCFMHLHCCTSLKMFDFIGFYAFDIFYILTLFLLFNGFYFLSYVRHSLPSVFIYFSYFIHTIYSVVICIFIFIIIFHVYSLCFPANHCAHALFLIVKHYKLDSVYKRC